MRPTTNSSIRNQVHDLSLMINANHNDLINIAKQIAALKGNYNADLEHAYKLAMTNEKRLTINYLDFTEQYKFILR